MNWLITELKNAGTNDKGLKVAAVIFNHLTLNSGMDDNKAAKIVATIFIEKNFDKINSLYDAAIAKNPYAGKNI